MLKTTEVATAAFSCSRFLEDARAIVPVDGRARHAWLPDGRTTLVFRVLDGGRRGDVCIAGPRTHALFKDIQGLKRAAIFQFKPGWSVQLFGVAANALTDQILPLEEIWGHAGSDLYADLFATRDMPGLVASVSRALASRPQRAFEPASARLARRATRLLEGGEARVEQVAEQLGVTARHLHRAFAENVGVGPKEFARAARLQRALRMMTPSNDWSRIATDAGYYDQAHFIADFRKLIGVTPGAFARRSSG